MFAIFLACAVSSHRHHTYNYPLEENKFHIKKHIKHIVKPITKPFEKVIKHTEKLVSKVFHETTRIIYDSRTSCYVEPVQITGFTKQTEVKDYTTSDPLGIIGTIVNEFNIDTQKITEFLTRSRFTASAKTLINSINFGALDDPNRRVASLKSSVIKITKEGSDYLIQVRSVTDEAAIYANTRIDSTKSTLGIPHHSHSTNCRALTASEITGIFNEINQDVSPELNEYKQI